MNINKDRLIKEINNKGIMLLGIGFFTNGIANYWKFLNDFISKMGKTRNTLDIFIDEPHPLIKNVDNIIKNKVDIKLSGDYNYAYDHPLRRYLSNVGNDHQEFLMFMKILNDLYNLGKKVNIYGIGSLLKRSDLNLIKTKYENKKYIKKFYPELANYDKKTKNFMKSLSYGIKDSENYMFNMIKYLKNPNSLGVIIANNTILENNKIKNFKSLGYMLNNEFGKKYKSVGTTGNKGKIRFIGLFKNKFQNKNVKVYPEFELFKKPKSIKFKDLGSFQRVIKNRELRGKKKDLIIKMTKDINAHYYRSNELLSDIDDKTNYSNVNNLDYVVYFNEVKPTHNIIVKKKKD
jgi:hypothetical protein